MSKLLLWALLLLMGCQGQDSAKKTASQGDTLRFRSVSDLNDAYLEMAPDGGFRYYRLLFDSVRNSSLSGTWTRKSDTVFLVYDQTEGPSILGSQAILDTAKHELRFFDARNVSPTIMKEK